MLRRNSLIEQLPFLLDDIYRKRNVKLHNLSDEDIVSLIPHLLKHKLEYLSFSSLTNTESINKFYIYTWHKQIDILSSMLHSTLKECECIFLQGFPRAIEYSHIIPPGMRTDIDIYIPEENLEKFYTICTANGFNRYGFTDNEIILLDQDAIDSFASEYWAKKDFTLTLPYKCNLPSDLPIDFGDCYLPWLYREEQWHLMVAIELHHYYVDKADQKTLTDNSEIWEKNSLLRCNLASLLYFNLVRLFKGVLSGENRLRLLLDTACILTEESVSHVMVELNTIFIQSPLNLQLRSLCLSLVAIHEIFNPLSMLCVNNALKNLSDDWNDKFFTSLTLEL